MTAEVKASIAKLMKPTGRWPGLVKGERFYYQPPSETPTGGALIVDNNDWPVKIIKPKILRPTPPTGEGPDYIDQTAIVKNAFGPEDVGKHKPIKSIKYTSAGTENEFRLKKTRVSQIMYALATEISLHHGKGYATAEIADDMIEANRPVVNNATFPKLVAGIENHTRNILAAVRYLGGTVIMTSSRPNTDTDVKSAPDAYVDGMVSLLAMYSLNTSSPTTMAWFSTTSATMLDNASPKQISEKALADHDFARRLALEFDASAIHAHVGVENPDPHFYAFAMNHDMGVIGPAMSVPTLSGPFRNGTYAKLHDMKLIHRLLFKTAGYQPAFYPMGSLEYLEEASKNISTGAASSLTRAGITGDRSHGEGRVRTEPFKTAERLYGSAHPLPEIEAAFAFAGNVNFAILSHYYKSNGKGIIPEYARMFYSEPEETRYHINRLQMAAHGPFATIIDGEGNAVGYSQFITKYADFVCSEVRRLGIKTTEIEGPGGVSIDEMTMFANWLKRSVSVPKEGWNMKNYMDKDHPDYGKGNFATHQIAELIVKVENDEKWRTHYKDETGQWIKVADQKDAKEWWKSVVINLKEGHYEKEIGEIMGDLAEAIEKRYE